MDKIEIKITVGKGMLKLQNLFNGDRVLGKFSLVWLFHTNLF